VLWAHAGRAANKTTMRKKQIFDFTIIPTSSLCTASLEQFPILIRDYFLLIVEIKAG